MKKVAIIGTTLVDQIKTIDYYPSKNALAKIDSIKQSVGGILPNVSIDLKKIDDDLAVYAIGKIGNDSNGRFILSILNENKVDTSLMIVDDEHQSGFTDVMTCPNGERTFFTHNGTNSYLTIEEVLSRIDDNVDFVHIGYALLLGYLDSKDEEYGTKLAKLLFLIKTNKKALISLDMVSSNDANARNIILPSLKYVDYLIINEMELSMIASLDVCQGEEIDIELIKKAMQEVFTFGKMRKIIVHCPKVNIAYDDVNGFTIVESLKLPKGYIKGAVGAGDAFASGVIYSLLNNFDDKKTLEVGCGAAVANLAAPDSISGAVDYETIEQLIKKYRG